MKKVKNILRNEKGLTLIELLAVVVILGIIAAIAIPAIGSIIENSKKDAYVSSAEQVISAARLAVAANDSKVYTPATGTETSASITTAKLVSEGYLEKMYDPAKKDVELTGTVTVDKDGKVTGITLGVSGTTKYVLIAPVAAATGKEAITINKITRDAVN